MASGRKAAAMLMVLLLLSAAAVMGYRREREWGEEGEEEEGGEEEDMPFARGGGRGQGHGRGRSHGSGRRGGTFMLGEPEVVVRTDSGTVRVARGFGWKGIPPSMHIGFIDMEPNSLFLPQYMDANLILFVKRGEARIGRIYEDDMVERDLKMGDVYKIPSGFAFYIENIGKGQTLQIICSIDTSESLEVGSFQSFFIGGGSYPTSVLSGFDTKTLTTALNATDEEAHALLSHQSGGPIIRMVGDAGSERSERLRRMMQLAHEKMCKRHEITEEDDDNDGDDGEESSRWSWRRVAKFLLGMEGNKRKGRKTAMGGKRKEDGPEPYNLYDRTPDFQNTYGYSVALDEEDYRELKRSGIGIYLVNLTAGSMLAPHLNPMASEYGVVLGGSGTIQVVLPNGSLAMNEEVNAGDAFWIPRYFPFCQIASRTGSLEFFGFTTSARKNYPQFLVGARSMLRSMAGPELAAAFGVSEERLDELVVAQNESVILPSWPPERRRGGRREREEEERRGRGRREEEGEEEEEERYGEEEEGWEPYIRRVGAM